jgi:hypothetical protein
MPLRARVSLIAVLVVLLVTAGIWVSAQQLRPSPLLGNGLDLVAPTVIAGNDLGFRIESNKDNIPVGKIVVRIDGHWVDAQVGSSGILAMDAK